MVADYISTSFVNGKAYGFFAVATAKSGTTFDQAIYTNQSGMDVVTAQGKHNSAGGQPASSLWSSRTPAPAPSRTWR